MRLPLEIVRLILIHASSYYTCEEFLQLRFANCAFSNLTQSLPNPKYHKLILLTLLDEEVRDIFFAHRGLESYRFYYNCGAVFGRNRIRRPLWDTVPASLRQNYLYHRVKRHRVEPSLFAHLFVPVFERRLHRLGISERDHVARHEKLKEWVGYYQHAHWKKSWVVTHATCRDVKGGLAYYDNCTNNDEEKRIENASKFLEICCAVFAGHQDTVLSAVYGFPSGVDDLNLLLWHYSTRICDRARYAGYAEAAASLHPFHLYSAS
jgi:hypothetical protein